MNYREAIDQINREVTVVDFLENTLGMQIGYLPTNISCPTHKDTNPSMRLYYPKDRGAYCFSCGKAYTAFDLVVTLYSLSVWEGVEWFKKNYGVVISKSEAKGGGEYAFDSHLASKVVSFVTTSEYFLKDRANTLRAVEKVICLSKQSGSFKLAIGLIKSCIDDSNKERAELLIKELKGA